MRLWELPFRGLSLEIWHKELNPHLGAIRKEASGLKRLNRKLNEYVQYVRE
jgi:hypothetical protein